VEWRLATRLWGLRSENIGPVYQSAGAPCFEQSVRSAARHHRGRFLQGRSVQWRWARSSKAVTSSLPPTRWLVPICRGRTARWLQQGGCGSRRGQPDGLVRAAASTCCQIAVCSGSRSTMPPKVCTLVPRRHPALPPQVWGITRQRKLLRGRPQAARRAAEIGQSCAQGPATGDMVGYQPSSLLGQGCHRWRWRGSSLGQGQQVKVQRRIPIRYAHSSPAGGIVNSPEMPMLIGPGVLPVSQAVSPRRDHRRSKKVRVWCLPPLEVKRFSRSAWTMKSAHNRRRRPGMVARRC